MVGTPIAKIPMLCEHCGKGFETFCAYCRDLGMRGFDEEIAEAFPTVVFCGDGESETAHRHVCPHCNRKQSDEHADWWYIGLSERGFYFHAADLIRLCKYCNAICGISEVCNRCKGNAHRYSNPKEVLEERGEVCPLCDKLCYPSDIQEHHVSYVPEETMRICRSCHAKIHNCEGFRDDLEPDMSREEWEEQRGWT